MPEGEVRYFRFGKFDGSRPEDGLVQNPLQLRDGIGNSTLQHVLQEFSGHHTLGKSEDFPAMHDLLSCFAPVSPEFSTKATTPMPDETFTTLADQIGDAYKNYNGLDRKGQKQIVNLTQYLVRSIAEWPQERKIQGEGRASSPHVQEIAEQLLAREDIWKGQTIKPSDTRELPKNAQAGQVSPRFAAFLLELTAVSALLTSCGKFEKTITPIATTPLGGTPSGEVTLDPTLQATAIATEYMPVGGTPTETAFVPTTPAVKTETPVPTAPEVSRPPDALPGIMPNTGSEFQPVALSPIQAAINALNYGVVYADGNVGKIANQTCISVVPEKIGNASGAAESLVSKDLTNGVAKYSGGMQVLAEVPLPANTDTDTYTCAMTYDKSNSVLYQTLVHTDVVTGDVEVLAAIPAAYSKSDKVEIINNTVKVNGETVNWTYLPGKEAPAQAQNWSLEVPATPEECTNVIPNIETGKMEDAITSLNQKILKEAWFPDGVPDFGYSKNTNFNQYIKADVASFWYEPHDNKSLQLYSCSKYDSDYVFGGFLYIPNGPIVPIQVFSDIELQQFIVKNGGLIYTDEKYNPAIKTLKYYSEAQGVHNVESLQLYYNDQFTDEMKQTATGELLKYLDEKYDYSNRIQDLMTNYGQNPTRDKETLDLLQTIILPGNVDIALP